MAGSKDPPKPKRGRPHGAVDKSRDYRGAVAKMRALIASDTSERTAAEMVGEELGIPASTLRKHLAKAPKDGPRFTIHTAFDVPTETVTTEQAEEAYRRYAELKRKKEEAKPQQSERDRQMEMLRRLNVLGPPHVVKKKPRK